MEIIKKLLTLKNTEVSCTILINGVLSYGLQNDKHFATLLIDINKGVILLLTIEPDIKLITPDEDKAIELLFSKFN